MQRKIFNGQVCFAFDASKTAAVPMLAVSIKPYGQAKYSALGNTSAGCCAIGRMVMMPLSIAIS